MITGTNGKTKPNITLTETANYIIHQTTTNNTNTNFLKLQKLVYYAQAWNLAIKKRPLFEGKFQAWVHGPISRELYDQFATTKSLYSPITKDNIDFDPNKIDPQDRTHIDTVLEVYATFTGSQLEEMTRQEDPWLTARNGYKPSQRCEKEIDEDLMRDYYTNRLTLNHN